MLCAKDCFNKLIFVVIAMLSNLLKYVDNFQKCITACVNQLGLRVSPFVYNSLQK